MVLFNPADFRIVDVQMIAIAENGARIGHGQIDTHFSIAPDFHLARFGRAVIHNNGNLSAFNISSDASEVLGLAVELFQYIFDRR